MILCDNRILVTHNRLCRCIVWGLKDRRADFSWQAGSVNKRSPAQRGVTAAVPPTVTDSNYMEHRHFLKADISSASHRRQSSLQNSQELAIRGHSEPEESSPRHPTVHPLPLNKTPDGPGASLNAGENIQCLDSAPAPCHSMYWPNSAQPAYDSC
jgi:hypothetical protein